MDVLCLTLIGTAGSPSLPRTRDENAEDRTTLPGLESMVTLGVESLDSPCGTGDVGVVSPAPFFSAWCGASRRPGSVQAPTGQ